MAHRKSQTPQSIQDIITALVAGDPRVAQCRMVDIAKQEQYAEDAMPLVLVELVKAKQSMPGTANIVRWDLVVAFLTLRRNDWANTPDAWSEGYNVLSDLTLRMQADPQLKSWGFKFSGNEPEYIFGNLRGRDDVISVSCEFSFTVPLALAPCDLIASTLPSPGSSYPGTPVPTPNYLTCDNITSCSVISGMLSSIAALSGATSGVQRVIAGTNILTGGTSSAVTISVNSSPQFNVIHADSGILKELQVQNAIQAEFIAANTSVYAPNVGADVFYSGGTDLSLLLTGGSKSLTVRYDASTFILPTLADAHSLIVSINSSTVSFGVDNDSTTNFPIGSQMMIKQGGTGQVRIVSAPGVTIQSYGSAYNLVGQFSTAVITKENANLWVLDGNLTTLNL